MDKLRNKRLVAVATAIAVVGGGAGAAIAASGGDRPAPRAFMDDVAKHLGVPSSKLEAAVRAAAIDRVDAARRAGRISAAQANRIKARIRSGRVPPLGGPGFFFGRRAPGPPFGKLDAAAKYLGLTDDQLHSRLESGKSLAQIARAQGKSVSGLEDALVADAKSHLDRAVTDKRLTRAEADDILKHVKEHVHEMVNRKPGHFRLRERHRFGPGGFGGPPPGGFGGPPPGLEDGGAAPGAGAPGPPPAPVPL